MRESDAFTIANIFQIHKLLHQKTPLKLVMLVLPCTDVAYQFETISRRLMT